MRRIHLNRRLVLEAETQLADGAGGFTHGWEVLGSIWAMIEAGPGREVIGPDRRKPKVPLSITVRAFPVGSAQRPAAGHRLREGTRRFRIVAVAERDRRGLYLTCQAEEEET